MLLYTSLAAALPFLHLLGSAAAQTTTATASGTWPTDLVGTWSTKSNKTLTGPGFYDPFTDRLIEPERTGISYSFTSDGYYEEAYYRAISNPTNPSCPSAIMQWQHGSWYMAANGSLFLTPIDVDGRQLLSEPCTQSNSIYTRYNQTEYFEGYGTLTDPYHNIPRLNLIEYNGEELQPLYLVYSPPQMLPTTTLNPTTATASATSKAKAKRSLDLDSDIPLNWKPQFFGASEKQTGDVVHHINADRLWWIGLAMTGVGGLLYLGPRRMGIQL